MSTDPRNEARHKRAVIARAASNPQGFVYALDWRERRALRRMATRGEAVPALSWPNTWKVKR